MKLLLLEMLVHKCNFSMQLFLGCKCSIAHSSYNLFDSPSVQTKNYKSWYSQLFLLDVQQLKGRCEASVV